MQSPVSMKCAENAGAMATLGVHRLIVIWCGVLFFVNGVGVSSVTKRCVHIGEAIKLFSDTCGKYEIVSMYAINELLIAAWSFKDDGIKIEHMNGNYSKRIYMDGNRNVWFLDVERTDAGKYVFKCGLHIEQLDLELTVLEKLTEEQLQECPNKCPGVSKMDFETITTMQYWERYRKGVSHYTTTAVSKGDDKEGGSHSATDHRITTILVLVIIILGIILLLFLSLCIWFACKMWNKTKPWTEDQVLKWLHDHRDFIEKNLEKQDSIEDHYTVSSQETQSIVPVKFGVDSRSPEEYKTDISVKEKITMYEQKGSPHGQPKLNMGQTKNVKRDRCSKSEDLVVDSTNPLLGKENQM